MAPTKLTARMSTGGGSPLKKVTKNIRKSAPAMKIHVNQLKEESEHRQAVIIQMNDEDEVKYDPNMAIKTEDLPAIKIEPGTSAQPFEDLSAAQEQVSLVRSLISKTVKLEAEVIEKETALEQLRREMVEMKNTMKAERQLLLSSLDQRKNDTAALNHRLAQEERSFREQKLALQTEINFQKQEKRTLQLQLDQRKIDSDIMSQGFAAERRRFREGKVALQQKVKRLEAEKQSLQTRLSQSASAAPSQPASLPPQPSSSNAGYPRPQKKVTYLLQTKPDGSPVLVAHPGDYQEGRLQVKREFASKQPSQEAAQSQFHTQQIQLTGAARTNMYQAPGNGRFYFRSKSQQTVQQVAVQSSLQIQQLQTQAQSAHRTKQEIEIPGRKSAKMWVLLENGEQRLITFTLPKATCTVKELLLQVGIGVTDDTNLDCIENPKESEIKFLVKVGNFEQSTDTASIKYRESYQSAVTKAP